MRLFAPLLATCLILPALGAQQRAPRQVVPMDSARAAQLYVSNKPEDHPVANDEQHIEGKARTDSIFAARSAGVMRYEKIRYRSSADGLEIPAYVFSPLTPRGAGAPAVQTIVFM